MSIIKIEAIFHLAWFKPVREALASKAIAFREHPKRSQPAFEDPPGIY